MLTCQAQTKKGLPCKNSTKETYCHLHIPKSILTTPIPIAIQPPKPILVSTQLTPQKLEMFAYRYFADQQRPIIKASHQNVTCGDIAYLLEMAWSKLSSIEQHNYEILALPKALAWETKQKLKIKPI